MNERLLTIFDAASGPFERGVSRVERSLGRFERGVDKRLRSFDQRWEQSARSIRMVERALLAIGTGAAANAVRNYAESWRQLQRYLVAAGFDAEKTRDKIVAAAIRVRGSAEDLALTVKLLSLATGDGFDVSLRRAETLKKLLELNGATAQQVQSVMLQMTQAIRSGRLQGNDFRSLQQNAPQQFLEAIARESGATLAQLREMSAKGKLSAEAMLRALDGLDSYADTHFARLALKGEEAFKILETGVSSFVGRVDESLGATETINRAIADMGEWLAGASDEAEQFAEALHYAAGAGASLAVGLAGASVVNALRRAAAARALLVAAAEAENLAAVRNLALARANVVAKGASTAATNALAAAEARATVASSALAAAQYRVSLAGAAAAAGTAAFTRVLAFFGGPVGLLITAAAAGVLLFAQHTREAAEETSNLKNNGDSLAGSLARLEELQRDLAGVTRDAGDAQSEASRQTRDALEKDIATLKEKIAQQRESLRLSQVTKLDRVTELETKIIRIGRVEAQMLASGRDNDAALARIRENRAAFSEERRKLIKAYYDAEDQLAAEEAAHAEKSTELPGITVTGSDSGGKGKKDKPPDLQGPEYDPGALFRDQLTEARELIDENRTAEEKLARAKARILALQPALVEAIRAEAFAHGEVISSAEAEVKAKAVIEQANARLVESAETVEQAQREAFQEFARGLASTIRQADSLSDALDKIADQLLDMVLDDAFSTLFGGKATSPLGSVFGFLSKGIGSLFGGGLGGGFTGLGVYADGGMVRGPGTGRSDSIPARLSNGEFVVNARSTARNRGLLEAINGGYPLRAFADGGLVTPAPAPIMAPPPRIETGGAVAATFAPSITVNVEGGDDAQATGAAAARAVQSVVQSEMAKSLRPGGMLDAALKGKR